MSRLGTITRRSFMVAGAAVAGGAAFGYYLYARDPENPLTAATGEIVFNPWVVVDAQGVTVITPRAEMGQGVQSTLAALVAEEMDMDWSQVRMAHGPAAAAYYNQAMLAESTNYPDYTDGIMKSAMSVLGGAMGKIVGIQATGGSSSTRDAYVKMRKAGASARLALVQAAADRWGQDPARLRTESGRVIAPDGATLAYADLAEAAARVAPDTDPALKPRSDWRLLGKSLPRLDMVEKVTGTAQFGIDVMLPGMVFASVRANPVLGAPVRGFDAGAALALPGVTRIVDLGNAVAVVADNTWHALQAAAEITFDSGPAPYPATSGAIMARIAEAFDGAPNDVLRDRGDVAALAGDGVIEAEYSVPYLAHATMEPMNATALFKDGKLTLWLGTQAPTVLRDKAAKLAGIGKDDVTIHTTYLGGGFGRRSEFDVGLQAAKVALEMPGTPVKLTWSREEDMAQDFYRPAAIARMRGKPGANGPEALDIRIATPSLIGQVMGRVIGLSPGGPDRSMTEGAFDQPYAIPNYRVAGHKADLQVPIGFWRSVGNSYNAFFHECFLDEMAAAGGHDPMEMRLRLMRAEHAPSAKVLEAVAEMCNWGAPLAPGRARGLAFCRSFGTPTAEVIEISHSDAGIKLEQVWAAVDVGTALDPRNIVAQVQSGIIYGLSAAIQGEITFEDGMVVQQNFPDYDGLRLYQVPPIEVKVLEVKPELSGIGEPGTPPAAPALANAIYALTGKRIRRLPLMHAVDFA